MLELCISWGGGRLKSFRWSNYKRNVRLLLQMAEQTQIQQETTKDPKKVEAGKGLVEHNRRKR